MQILVTGGCGYIGSHIVIELIKNNYLPIILDSSPKAVTVVNQIKSIYKTEPVLFNKWISLNILNDISKNYNIDGVIHLAGYKSVNESVNKPFIYYKNNIFSSIALLNFMNSKNIKNLIFSSSATVYGNSKIQPIKENFKIAPTNPYGTTKSIVENLISDFSKVNFNFKAISLRYFNPIGSHNSKKLKMNIDKYQNNLLPVLIRSVLNNQKFHIYGSDYPTIDGTCMRDYIHVTDVAKAHIKALENLRNLKNHTQINIGTGRAYSTLEVIKTFEKANKIKLDYAFTKKRKGDVPICFADINKSKKLLKWSAKSSLTKMCKDSFAPFK